MDAHALLTSQGWRGSGNSLHPTSNSIGLSRPLLVSRKVDNLGIGKKQHRTSDMWWMNAFDSSLKGLDTSQEGQVTQTVTSGGLDMVNKGGAKWVGSKGGLYASFVRGEALSGTLTEEESVRKVQEVGGKRKRVEADGEESKEERRARKAAKRVMEEEDLLKAERAESKEERRTRRSAKKLAKETLVVEKEESEKPGTREERKAQRAAKRALKEQKSKPSEIDASATESKAESKGERRERKRLKKLAQGAKDSSDDSTSKSKKKRQKE